LADTIVISLQVVSGMLPIADITDFAVPLAASDHNCVFSLPSKAMGTSPYRIMARPYDLAPMILREIDPIAARMTPSYSWPCGDFDA
jgi:hypothetical protein